MTTEECWTMMDAMMGGGMMGGVMWIGMILSAVLGIALLVLVVAGIVWLVRQLQGDTRHGSGTGRRALEELQLRFARGEIDRDTFLAMRRDLELDTD